MVLILKEAIVSVLKPQPCRTPAERWVLYILSLATVVMAIGQLLAGATGWWLVLAVAFLVTSFLIIYSTFQETRLAAKRQR